MLFWGILGVIVLRALMIGVGAALVAQFSWVLYVFAAFLIVTGVKMLSVVENGLRHREEPGAALHAQAASTSRTSCTASASS